MYRISVATVALILFASAGWSQDFGPIKESQWASADTTETIKLATVAARHVWDRDPIGSHDELTSAVENAAISDAAKVNLLIQIPKALRSGGVESLWKAASLELRKAIMRAAADNLEGEAERMEARAALLRTYATRIDDGAASYTASIGF